MVQEFVVGDLQLTRFCCLPVLPELRLGYQPLWPCPLLYLGARSVSSLKLYAHRLECRQLRRGIVIVGNVPLA